jgi:hypothetical protein
MEEKRISLSAEPKPTLWTIGDTEGVMHIVYGPEQETSDYVASLVGWFVENYGDFVGQFMPLAVQKGCAQDFPFRSELCWLVSVDTHDKGMSIKVRQGHDTREGDEE